MLTVQIKSGLKTSFLKGGLDIIIGNDRALLSISFLPWMMSTEGRMVQ